MARIRTIKPQFFSSHDVAKLSFRERITWIGLWTHVDDEGRCQDDGRIIKGAIFPLEDNVTWQDVDSDISQLSELGLITRYEVSGSKYLLITNWKKHQKINRPTKSFIPAPTDSITEDSLNTHVVITEDSRWEKENEKEKEVGKAPTRIPELFPLTPELKEWANKNTPGMDLETKHLKFVSHYQSAAGDSAIKLDWNRAWQTWMLGDFDKQKATKPPIPIRSPADTRMEDLFCKDHTGWPQDDCERCKEERAVSA